MSNCEFYSHKTHTFILFVLYIIAVSNALLKSSEPVSRKYFNEKSCPLKLYLKVELGNVISYKWEKQDGSTKGIKKVTRQTNATTYFENSFLLYKTNVKLKTELKLNGYFIKYGH